MKGKNIILIGVGASAIAASLKMAVDSYQHKISARRYAV